MKTPEQLADEHWEYVRGVIDRENLAVEHMALGMDEYLVKIEFHFKTAMIHGYKHGLAAAKERAES